MSERYEKPVVKVKQGVRDEVTETHPAYAQISASRVSGKAYLYGSDFDHQHCVTISIHASELNRSLSRDWHNSREEYIEVALSEAQWAAFVSRMNHQGVPCTLYHINGKMVPQIPSQPERRQQFDSELKALLGIVEDALKALGNKIKDCPLSGKAKSALLDELNTALLNLTPNLSFVADQFGEHMENLTEQAKVEIGAYIESAITRAGIEALNGSSPITLPDITDAGEREK